MNTLKYSILLSFFHLFFSCGGGGGNSTPVDPGPIKPIDEAVVTNAKLEISGGTLNAKFTDKSTSSTLSVSSVPTVIKLVELTLSDKKTVPKDESLPLNGSKVSFTNSNKIYTITFTTDIQTGQGSEAKVIDLEMRITGETAQRVIFDSNKKAIIQFNFNKDYPFNVTISRITLSTNATSEFTKDHELTITEQNKLLTFNVVSGDRTLTEAYTIELNKNTATSNSITLFVFLPHVGGNSENNQNKKGLSRAYYGVIDDKNQANGNKITVQLPKQTKTRLSASIVHTGTSIDPSNETLQLFEAGIQYDIKNSNDESKIYTVSVLFTLADEFIDINEAKIGPKSVPVVNLSTETTTGIPIDSNFTFGFTHNITPESALGKIKILKANSEIDIRIAQGSTPDKLIITPNSNLSAGTTYTLVFGAGLKTVVDGTSYFILEEKRTSFITE